jgi:hypothetical protein
MKAKESQEKPVLKRPLLRRGLILMAWVFSIICIGLLIGAFLLESWLASNQEKIWKELSFLNQGSILFHRAKISILPNFPLASLTLHQVQLSDHRFPEHQVPFLRLEEMHAAFSLFHFWKKKEIHFKSITLKNGAINLFTDQNGHNLLAALFKKNDKHIAEPKLMYGLQDIQFKRNKFKIKLKNVNISLLNEQKQSNITALAHNLSGNISLQDTLTRCQFDLDLAVEQMSFHLKKGAFLRNSRIRGKPQIDLKDGMVYLKPVELKVNQETFLFQGQFDTQKKRISELTLDNQHTQLPHILPLLPKNIQFQLRHYQIKKPLKTHTTIQGFFRRGEEPIITIDFQMQQNELEVFNMPWKKVDLKGRFVNRLFSGEKVWSEGRKRLRIEIHELSASHEGFRLNTEDALITVSPETGPRLRTEMTVSGAAEAISTWLANDQFLLEEGRFKLKAKVNGPLNNFNQLVIESQADIELDQLSVYYPKADVSFPFKHLSLSKQAGDADFKLLSSAVRKGHNFQLTGMMQNIPALILDLKGQSVSSKADFSAEKIAWRDFMDWFGKKGKLSRNISKNDREKKRSMKQTIGGIHERFHPQLSMEIDSLVYYDLITFEDFQTGVTFEDTNHVVLEKTSFHYEQGNVEFSARIDISDSTQTPFQFELRTESLNLKKLLPPLDYFNIKLLADLERLPDDLDLQLSLNGIIDDQKGLKANSAIGSIRFSIEDGEILSGHIYFEPDPALMKDSLNNNSFTKARIQLTGDPTVFNDFLKTENFFFSQGRFSLDIDYQNDPASFAELLNNGTARLKIRNSNVFYKPAAVDFPLTKIDLFVDNDIADFNLFLRSDTLNQEISLRGVIDNLSELVIGNTGKSIRTAVDVSSPKLIWSQFFYIFAPEPRPDQVLNLQTLKTALKGIFGTFSPTLRIQTDSFIYSDQIALIDFSSGMFMRPDSQLVLEKTTFDFHDGGMSLEGRFDLTHPEQLPFSSRFTTQDLDVEKLLKSLDYVGLPSLRSIKKLSGRITMDFDLSGSIAADGKSLVPEKTQGLLDVSIKQVELSGMQPLDELAKKIRMKKRFSNLRFAPIENRIHIKGRQIEIPLMEVQSNAFNLFIEGTLSYDDQTNLWVSIPLNNIHKPRDLNFVPARRGYAASKRKVYFEVTSDEEGNNDFTFRISKRKFYEHRGILPQFKKDKRKYRKERRRRRQHQF